MRMGSPCRKSVFGVNVSRPPAKRRQRRCEYELVQRAWNVWMNDIRSRRSFLARALSITVGVLSIVAVVLVVIRFIVACSDPHVSSELASFPLAHIATATAPVAMPSSPASLTLPQGLARATVTNVADGDTIEVSLNGQTGRIRLIGVDTSEPSHPSRPVECYGREASAFTREVLRGQMVLPRCH
jgi:micrococcal nuclease